MSECKLGTYIDIGGFGAPAFVSRCGCTNCTEREAQVQAEANARRKALLALDAAMRDLAAPSYSFSDTEETVGRICNANDAWVAARHYIIGGGA